jgi:hypothetical protein
MNDAHRGVDISRLPAVPKCSRNRLRDLWGSMFVSYPPVTRIHIVDKCLRDVPRRFERALPGARYGYHTKLLRPAGVVGRDLLDATKRPDRCPRKLEVLMVYPERLYHKHSEQFEEEN